MRLAVLLLCVCSPLVFAAGPSRPPKPIFPIGKDTTFVEGPRDAEGYIDYAAAINRRFAGGVRPENNAAALLWTAIGPGPSPHRGERPEVYFPALRIKPPPEKGDYFIDLERF